MKKILSYVPFTCVLFIDIAIMYVFNLTGSLGMLSLMVPGVLALILTLEMTNDDYISKL